jgi:hypothetical protein
MSDRKGGRGYPKEIDQRGQHLDAESPTPQQIPPWSYFIGGMHWGYAWSNLRLEGHCVYQAMCGLEELVPRIVA